MADEPKRPDKGGKGELKPADLVRKKTLLKKATLRDQDVAVIEIRVRPPQSRLLGRRGIVGPRPPQDMDIRDMDRDLRDPVLIYDTDMNDVIRTMDMDPHDPIPIV